MNRLGRHKLGGVALLMGAILLLVPAFGYADVPVASIMGPENFPEPENNPSNLQFLVTLTGGMGSEPVIVDYTVTGTAEKDVDYTAPSGRLEIGARESTGTITISVLNDELNEQGETVVVTLTDANTSAGMVAVGTPDKATTMIRSSDITTVSVTAGSNGVVLENLDATFTISSVAATTAHVAYTIIPGSATAADYSASTARGTISPTDPREFTVDIVDDEFAEEEESFSVKLSLVDAPANVALGTAVATMRITDNDLLTASVIRESGTVVEGSEAVFKVAFENRELGSTDVVVHYRVIGGDGLTENDYTAPDGSVRIGAGQTTGAITIPTLEDDELERDEKLTVTLTSVDTTVTTSGVGVPPSAMTTIGDAGTVTVSMSDTRVVEGASAMFTVTLSGEVSDEVLLKYFTSEAGVPEDFTAVPDSPDMILTISPGETSGTIPVQTKSDDLVEGPEPFTVTLLPPSEGQLPQKVKLGRATATATITDDDSLRVSVAGPQTVAAGSEPALYTVSLSGGTSTASVVVNYTVTGTAEEGEDYTAPSGQLEILSPGASGTITIKTKSDQEVDETLIVTLTDAHTDNGEVAVGTPARATTTIKSSDTVTVDVSLDTNSATLNEGEGAVFNITLSEPASEKVTVVSYATTPGSATTEDYSAATASGTLTIAVTAMEGSFTVNTVDDPLSEDAETFTVQLTLVDAQGSVALGTAKAEAEITDNDPIVANAVDATFGTIQEGERATFTVDLTVNETLQSGATGSRRGSQDVLVEYTMATSTAKATDDYEVPSGRLTIPAGEPTGTITIQTLKDDLLEGHEDLIVMLTGVSTGAGAVALATDNPSDKTTIGAGGSVEVVVADTTVDEGEPALFKVTLSGKVGEDVKLDYTTAEVTATSGDFTAQTAGKLTIGAGETTATITVPTTTDTVYEADETFTVMLMKATGDDAPPDGLGFRRDTATGTIEDDDALTATLSGPRTVRISTPAEFTVTLTGGTVATGVTPTVNCTYTVGGETNTCLPANLSVSAGDETGTITIPGDKLGSEGSLVVRLTSVSVGALAVSGTPRQVTATIRDIPVVSVSGPGEVTEGTGAAFTLTGLSDLPAGTRVKVATVDGSAKKGSDYDETVATRDSVENTSTSFSVPTTLDSLEEGDETFTVQLTLEGNRSAAALGTARATATIADATATSATVTRETPDVSEGSSATFKVTLSNPASANVVVHYTVIEGGGADKGDYTAPSGRLTISVRKTTGTITIRTLADDVLETGEYGGPPPLQVSESLAVRLLSATTSQGEVTTPATEADATSDSVMIADDVRTVTVSVADTTVDEGEPALFKVTLSGKVGEDVKLDYTTAEVTATSGDFTAQTAGKLTIGAGETTATITVPTTTDTVYEADETFTVMLMKATGDDAPPDGLGFRRDTATGTIEDDDALTATLSGPRTVRISTPAEFTVTLTGGTVATGVTPTVNCTYTVGGETNTCLPANLSVSAGDETGTITIPGDKLGSEGSLVVRLTSVSVGALAVSGTPRQVTATIRDIPVVSVSGPGEVTEGTGAAFTLTGLSDLPAGTRVKVATVDGSAKKGSDYDETVATRDSVENTSTSFSVPTTLDSLEEGDETFTVQLTLEGNRSAAALGTARATATIADATATSATVTRETPDVSEGSSATFKVTLSNPASANVVVHYTVIEGGGADKGDYTAPSGRLTISVRKTTGTITIRTLADDVLETGETLAVRLLSATTSQGEVTTPATEADATSDSVMIADDVRTVTVSVADTTVDEGETAWFTVELSGKVAANVTVTFDVVDGTAGAPADYLDPSERQVTVEAGETTTTITVKTVEDKLAEAAEMFTVTLPADQNASLPAGVSLKDASATATITDDALTATLTGPSSVDEGDSAEYTVTLTGFSGDEDLNVEFSTEGSTATAGQDFSPDSGSVTIPAGESSASFTIDVRDDTIVDLRETLVVTASVETADGDAVRTEGEVRTRIVDDGTVQVSVAADQEVVAAGQDATFTVTLAGTVAEELTIYYSTGASGDTATGGQDYTAASNATLTIAPQQTSGTITVPITDDGQDEDDETLTVSLDPSAPAPGVEIETATATVTITDHALQASVSAPTLATVIEGQAVTFTVSLTGGDNRSGVTVDYELGGSAVSPSDYDGPSSGTLTIPQGQSSGAITITTNTDGVLDPGEDLSVTLTSVEVVGAGLAAPGSPATASVTIVDQQIVTWSVADIEFDEDQDAVFTVTLDDLVRDAVTLTYATADGTATAGSDYTAVSNGRVTVAGGSTSATFTVQVTDASNGEASETFTVRLTRSNAPAGVEPPSDTATATIRDNDLALLPIEDVTVTEGGQANILVRLERALQEPVRIGYRTAGSAIAGEDYTFSVPVIGDLPLPQGAIEVPANVQQGVVTVTALDDALAEGDERFTVTLTTVPTDGSAPVPLGQAMVTIEDNDVLSVSVTAPKTVAEGDIARFTVRVGGGESTAPVEVSYSLGGTAKAPADYSAPSPTMVSIPAGQQTATIAIQTKADKVLEPDETLVVTLTEATTTAGEADVGSPKSATTRIQDPVYHSINRVNQTLLPGITRASASGALEAVSARMAQAAQGDPPAAMADLAGLTGLYRSLQANERAVQDGSYDLAQVLGGSSFLVPLSSHDGDSGGGVRAAFWGGGDFRGISGGDTDAADVDWGGSVWSARLGADMRFVDSLLTGLTVSWTSGGLDYIDQLAPTDREGTYATWLISAHPYVGWTTTDFGLWATGGFGFGGVSIDDADEDYEAQEADLTQWSLGTGASVTLLSTDWFIAGGTTSLKLKAEGFLAGASVAENEAKTIQALDVGVNQARAAIEASHAQHFADGGTLKPSLEIGGRLDGGHGETGAGLEVGGGVTYADSASGLTVAGGGRVLVVHGGNYGEWGLSGLIQLDPNSAGHGLSMSVRSILGVAASGVNGLWGHGTIDLLAGGQPGGRVETEIGYGLPAFGMAGVLTPYAGAELTDNGSRSLSLGGRLKLGPTFDLGLEAKRRESAGGDTVKHDITLEGSVRW